MSNPFSLAASSAMIAVSDDAFSLPVESTEKNLLSVHVTSFDVQPASFDVDPPVNQISTSFTIQNHPFTTTCSSSTIIVQDDNYQDTIPSTVIVKKIMPVVIPFRSYKSVLVGSTCETFVQSAEPVAADGGGVSTYRWSVVGPRRTTPKGVGKNTGGSIFKTTLELYPNICENAIIVDEVLVKKEIEHRGLKHGGLKRNTNNKNDRKVYPSSNYFNILAHLECDDDVVDNHLNEEEQEIKKGYSVARGNDQVDALVVPDIIMVPKESKKCSSTMNEEHNIPDEVKQVVHQETCQSTIIGMSSMEVLLVRDNEDQSHKIVDVNAREQTVTSMDEGNFIERSGISRNCLGVRSDNKSYDFKELDFELMGDNEMENKIIASSESIGGLRDITKYSIIAGTNENVGGKKNKKVWLKARDYLKLGLVNNKQTTSHTRLQKQRKDKSSKDYSFMKKESLAPIKSQMNQIDQVVVPAALSARARLHNLLRRLLPAMLLMSCGYMVSAASLDAEDNPIVPMKIHDWPVLKDITDHAIDVLTQANNNHGDMSIEEFERTTALTATLESLALLHESAIENLSEEDQVNLLKDISASMSAFEVFLTEFKMDVENLPKEFHNHIDGAFKQLRSSLVRASIVMDDLVDFVELSIGHKEEEDVSSVRQRSGDKKLKSIDYTARALYTIDNSTSQISRGEYEMRARGYHGFMAEDQKIDSILHAPGGKGVKMYDHIEEQMAGMGFQVPNSFQSSFHMNSGSLHGRRRLNDNGVCAVPDPGDLKVERCNRLLACVKEFSSFDLFMYYFGDNLDDNTGEIRSDGSVKYADERDIVTKYNRIKDILNDDIPNDYKCDALLPLFHRYDEAKDKFVGGSVTSICRSWGTTKKISLKSIYDFFRYRFLLKEVDTESNSTTWEEKDEVYLGPKDINSFIIEHGGIKEDFYELLIVGRGQGDLMGGIIGIQENDDGIRFPGEPSSPIVCKTGSGLSQNGAYAPPCIFEFDPKNYGLDDGKFDIAASDPAGYYNYTIYDYRALKNIGMIYDELLGCVTTIRDKLNIFSDFNDWPIFPGIPMSGLNPEIFDEHGKFDRVYTTIYEIGNFPYKGIYDPWKIDSELEYGDFNSFFYSDFINFFNTYPVDNNYEKSKDPFYYVPAFINFTDTTSTLLFGEETTIGQICSYAKAAEAGTLTALPGYCCLDAPYESKLWGETYSCYEEYGPNKGQLRPSSDCINKGPAFASFNEAACNPFGGTWCPLSRNCNVLKTCVMDEKASAEQDPTRKAFFAYLDDAPKVNDTDSTVQCGDLREYLEFDRDYPDDDRICDELKAIQCRNEFTNLSEATGSGSDAGDEELIIIDKFQARSLVFYDKSEAAAFRASLKGLEAAVKIAKTVRDFLEASTLHACLGFISAAAGTAGPCAFSVTVAKIVALVVYVILVAAQVVVSSLYSSMVQTPDIYASRELQEVNYGNILTVGKNGVTTFKAVQQVKALLGNFADDYYDSIAEDADGRRLQVSCSASDNCSLGNCDCPSESDQTRFCDCSLNWEYIKLQMGAGCDLNDSDGDRIVDICEDRFAPGLVFPNTFQCDPSMPKRLCYDTTVFKSYLEAEKFLRDGVKTIDDCATSSQLSYDISKIDGTSCSSTMYEIKPFQDYNKENWFANCSPSNFTNPLYGVTKDVTMRVDDSDPVITCGFIDVHIDTPYIEIDGKVLYHRVPSSGSNTVSLAKSLFWYKVTDNCEDADVSIGVEVKTNELQYQGDVAKISKYQFNGYVNQAEVLYLPTSCGILNYTDCSRDEQVSPYFRLYEIDVTAEDSASRTATDTCHIIIIPECDEFIDDASCDLIGGKKYYKKDFLVDQIPNSLFRNQLATASLSWDFTMKHDFASLYTNTYSPSLTPSSQPSSMPSSHPSSNPSSQPSSIPSSNPSSQPSSIPSDFPTFFPVIECGFRDTNHIDVVANKTLYFYSGFNGRKGLVDSKFFFQVMDKSTEINSYNNISVQVKSNEFERGKYDMSSLAIDTATNPMDQVRFKFLANDCGGVSKSQKSSCNLDPSIEYPIRFYEVLVQTVDPYGRSDYDTCYVVIVPKCNSKYDPNCVDFVEEHHQYHHDLHDDPNVDHTHHTNSGKLKNVKDHPNGDYIRLEYLHELVLKSSNRFDLTSLELQWTFV